MVGADDGIRRGRRVQLAVSFLTFVCKTSVGAFQLSLPGRSTPRRPQSLYSLQGPASIATDFTASDLVLPEDPVQHFYFADPDLTFDQCPTEVQHEPTPPTTLPSIDMLMMNGLMAYDPTYPPPASVLERSAWGLPQNRTCLLYTSPSPRDRTRSRMPSSA